ncbi:MAG: DUF393 domain-containing protein [Verrucomicrobiota bacterium]
MSEKSRNLLFYDSDCGFCQASVDWMASRDTQKLIRFVRYDDKETLHKHPQIDPEHVDLGVQFLNAQGRHSFDSLAIADTLKLLPNYGWLGTFITLPVIRFFAQLGYRAIAKNRHYISRLLGLNACKI